MNICWLSKRVDVYDLYCVCWSMPYSGFSVLDCESIYEVGCIVAHPIDEDATS